MTADELRAALDAIPISAKKAASQLGISRRTLTRMLQGHTPISPLKAAGIKAQLEAIKKSQRKRK